MEKMGIPLSQEELAQVGGGVATKMENGKLTITLQPGESAVKELRRKLDEGIFVFGIPVSVVDDKGLLMKAAKYLDRETDTVRCCCVSYSQHGFTTVVLESIVFI